MLNERYNVMKINKEKLRLLKQELKEYERITPMTEEERSAVREWVSAGNSVHENAAMFSCEGGRPMDFLDVYRELEHLRKATANMTYDEESRYLLEEYGINRDEKPEPRPAFEDLCKRTKRIYRTCMLYRDVLIMNDLKDEADEYVMDNIDVELPFDLFDWSLEMWQGGLQWEKQ